MRHLAIHPSRLLIRPSLNVVARSDDRATVAIAGLVCGLCASRTQAAIAAMPGVKTVNVDLEDGLALVDYDAAMPVDEYALRSALDRVVVAKTGRRALAALGQRWWSAGRRSR